MASKKNFPASSTDEAFARIVGSGRSVPTVEESEVSVPENLSAMSPENLSALSLESLSTLSPEPQGYMEPKSESGSPDESETASKESLGACDTEDVKIYNPKTAAEKKKSNTKSSSAHIGHKFYLTPELTAALKHRVYLDDDLDRSGHVRAALEIYLAEDLEAIRREKS